MHILLEIIDGPLAGRKIPLRGRMTLNVGRTEHADYAIPGDSEMSSVHFEIAADQTQIRIRDLKSTNGTFVNETQVDETSLQHEDIVRAGQTRFQIHVLDLDSPKVDASADVTVHTPTTTRSLRSSSQATPPLDPQSSADSQPRSAGPAEMSLDRPNPVPGESPPAFREQANAAESAPRQTTGRRPRGVVLEVLNGPEHGDLVWLIPGQTMTVGRTAHSEFILPGDPAISGRHCCLEYQPSGCTVRDLGSENGTQVNGQDVGEQKLCDGDILTLGSTQLRVSIDGVQPPTDQPSANVTAPLEGLEIRSTRPYRAAFRDDDPSVRVAAFEAAVWTRQTWLLRHCRELAREPVAEHLIAYELLAILGEPEDVSLVQTILQTDSLAAPRLRIAGMYGHPRILPDLINLFDHTDLRTAVAAGSAFQKISGINIESDERTTLPPEDGSEPDAFEREFLDEARLPVADIARGYLKQHATELNRGHRFCQGIDLSGGLTAEIFQNLDQQSRWEAALRAHYRRESIASARELLSLHARLAP